MRAAVLNRQPGTLDIEDVRKRVEKQYLVTVWDDLEIWRYQKYIERPSLSKIDAKPYMAMRKWATQFYETAEVTSGTHRSSLTR